MKLLRVAFAVAFAAAFGNAWAFHDGGVARCSGCHTMHNSQTGLTAVDSTYGTVSATTPASDNTNGYLLKGQDVSSTCLNCHAGSNGSYTVMDKTVTVGGTMNLNTANFTPGGDFAWLRIGSDTIARGQRKGHNIVAADFGLVADTRTEPPGGTWDGLGGFSCVSCHDPHGQSRQVAGTGSWSRGGAPIEGSSSYVSFEGVPGGLPGAGLAWGAYRLLGSNGWDARSSASPAITVDPPIAVAPNTYNRSEGTFAGTAGTGPIIGQTVVGYVSGMSAFCGTCHGAMHTNSNSRGYGANLRHPSGSAALLNAGIVANYNSYLRTGNTTGTAGNTYDALVPFELNGTRADGAGIAADVTQTTTAQAAATSTVMCLTCHRAHASGFDSMLRFSIADAFVGEWSLPNDQVAMYGRPDLSYGAFQRPLCNKCHVKD